MFMFMAKEDRNILFTAFPSLGIEASIFNVYLIDTSLLLFYGSLKILYFFSFFFCAYKKNATIERLRGSNHVHKEKPIIVFSFVFYLPLIRITDKTADLTKACSAFLFSSTKADIFTRSSI